MKDFIRIKVPGYEKEMAQIEKIYKEAYNNPCNYPIASFMDLWVPNANLVANGDKDFPELYKDNYLNQPIDKDGYVSSRQHFSHAKNDGWPFPAFCQNWKLVGKKADTFGYIFTTEPEKTDGFVHNYLDFLADYDTLNTKENETFVLSDLVSEGVEEKGWKMKVAGDNPSIELTDIDINAVCCPFIQIRIDFKSDKPLKGKFLWKCEGDTEFNKETEFDLIGNDPFNKENTATFAEFEMGNNPRWKGKITGLKFVLPGCVKEYKLDSVFSCIDTRHQMNSFNYLQGAFAAINNTGDFNFVRKVIKRMRKVMKYAVDSLYEDDIKMLRVKFYGHDGLPGYINHPDGTRTYNFANGIGGNYWDILPCGNIETYTGIYFYNSLLKMAELEKYLADKTEKDENYIAPEKLIYIAENIKETANTRLWNEETKRFYIAEDINGNKYDYGFVMLNIEAVYYGLATEEHAKDIMDWVSGVRIVEGDTSQGADIYKWRLAPRNTTKINRDYYFWDWHDPDQFPFGTQVQDGGAIFNQSFNDMMSRIKVYGADNAWERFKGILDWYSDIEKAGGYRQYYDNYPENNMQGSGEAGGIGIDMEFVESIITPYTIVEGFLGYKATVQGFDIKPNLPKEWDSVEIDNIYFRNISLDIIAKRDKISVKPNGRIDCPVIINGKEYILDNNEIIIMP
ncbi:MAG: hypothetical protein KBT47_09465 [Armatimonadetes bacterium]|nr:hypothetical protein [Candidatus Hippobium faecium]